jgi:putative aldouronate transport system substrate-binding protein
MKKLCGILLLLFSVSLVPACGNGGIIPGTGTSWSATGPSSAGGIPPMPDTKKPVTYRIFVRDFGTAPSKENPVLRKITELTGVTIDFEFLVGDLDQKMGLMIAGEDYPDAIFADAQKFVDAGAFIPLEDKLPNYPNLNALYSPHYKKMTFDDGHRYLLELYFSNRPSPIFTNSGAGFFIQKAVLEEAGYPIPKTLEEYFRLIEDYRAKHAVIEGVKTIGFEILCDGWRDFCLRNPPQHLMGAGNDGDVFVDPNTFRASCYQISETAKNYYRKLNEEYGKGIIEAETFTQNYDQYISRLASGAVLGFFDQGWDIIPAENILKADKKFNRTYVSVPISNPGVRDSYLDSPNATITGINGIGITKNCKDPDRLLAFYDWLLRREVQEYLQWGEEGKDWVRVGLNGRSLTKERRDLNNDDARRRNLTGITLWNYSPQMMGSYEDGTPCGPGDSEQEYRAALSEYDRKFLNGYGIDFPAQLLSEPVKRPAYYPVWAMPIAEGSAASVANTKMVDTCRKYYPRLILSRPAEFDAMWDIFVQDFKKGNPQPYLDEVDQLIAKGMK